MSIKSIIQRLKRVLCCGRSSGRQVGTIKFFDRKKRFGFIVSGQHEYFFHAAATNPLDFKGLKDGVPVTFEVVQGKKGPQADHIELS